MSKEETTNTPEVKEESEATVNQSTEEQAAEESVGQLHEEESSVSEKQVPDLVPKSRLDKEIKRRKELQRELAEERKEVESEDPDDEPEEDSQVAKLAKDLEEIKRRERQAQLEQTFEKHYSKALENNPDFKSIANKEVIKQMAFNPANKNKTYSQLLQEAYGNAIPGRKTIETTTPRGGAVDTKVDVDRARTDAEYRRQVLADPDLRKQYNQGLEKRLRL